MNVFVLSTGRSGTETFARACQHFTNYTAAHESQNFWLHFGVERPYRSLRYPERHIEVDNRLTWFLGTLDREYGDGAFYVHLLRRREEVARSLARRGEGSVLFSFAAGTLQYAGEAHALTPEEWYEIGLQYWDTVNDNISFFLRGRPRQATMWLHDVEAPFADFCRAIGAEGDLEAAGREWTVRHNVGKPHANAGAEDASWVSRRRLATREIASLVPDGQSFILVDDAQLGAAATVAGRPCLPFLEKDGRYWGPPPDDATAIRELERLRQGGARYLVVGWPAFWWLMQYPQLERHLSSTYRCALRNERLVAYDLHG